jgi:hypothetical protein
VGFFFVCVFPFLGGFFLIFTWNLLFWGFLVFSLWLLRKRRENGRNWDLVSWGFLFFFFLLFSSRVERGFLGFAHFLVSNYEFGLKTLILRGFTFSPLLG